MTISIATATYVMVLADVVAWRGRGRLSLDVTVSIGMGGVVACDVAGCKSEECRQCGGYEEVHDRVVISVRSWGERGASLVKKIDHSISLKNL